MRIRTLAGFRLAASALALAAAVVLTPGARAQEVSFTSLLREMADRGAIARWPAPAYVCRQASSYDRDSVAPDQPGWFANWDRSQFVRSEERDGRTEHVLLDATGPGAIVRFWATWHGPGGGPFTNGTLRIYCDGAAQPAIEGPLADLISGGALAGEPFAESVSPETEYAHRGHNLYLPIPFADGCLVTYETSAPIDRGAHQGEALYYQIDYRAYAPGTTVRTFRRADLTEHAELVADVGEALRHNPAADGATEGHAVSFGGDLAPGASSERRLGRGEQEIRYLSFELKAGDLAQALRSTVVELTFDGERTVWCPLGELAGAGRGEREFQTYWTRTVLQDGLVVVLLSWPMPFRTEARLSVRNLGQETVAVHGTAILAERPWDERSMYFHATWRLLPAAATRGRKGMDGGGAYDVNYVTVEGQGVYAGDTLSIFNGAASWWGEGDEKIWVDGESFPSHIGTGTEDYYGYAWCRPEPFATPFHAQPSGAGNLQVGASTNSRYRVLDGIPFQERLQFDMELWHWADTRIDFAPAAFWYARPGARCNVEPDPAGAARPLSRQRSDIVEVLRVPGAIEGEAMAVLECGGGQTSVQQSGTWQWSDEQQLWWIDGAPGQRLLLGFDAPAAGRYRVVARLTRASDYGIVRLDLNGAPAGEWDRYHPSVETTEADLGVFELRRSGNRLGIEILGRHEAAVPRHMFGLDALVLAPVAEGR